MPKDKEAKDQVEETENPELDTEEAKAYGSRPYSDEESEDM